MNVIVSLIVASLTGSALGASAGYLRPSDIKGGATEHSMAATSPKEDAQHENTLSTLRELKPIIVNLTSPAGAWVRLEAALVFDSSTKEDRDRLASEISGDFAAYLRTLDAGQLQGALGLQFLREDLRERAALRVGDKVRDVVIETLVIQ